MDEESAISKSDRSSRRHAATRGIRGAVAFQLHSNAVIGVIVFPAVGLIIAGVVAVVSAVGIAAVFRAKKLAGAISAAVVTFAALVPIVVGLIA